MRNLMLRLVRHVLRLPGRHERGAIGVLVGILIGAGVLVGMGAMVVDVGQLYQNRAELQNGADAGALAVAQSCASGSCTSSVAKYYADANAKSGVAGVDLVCGSAGLGACPASTGKIYDCPAAPAATATYVDVHTETETATGSSLLLPAFARTLLGNGNYQGSTVYACAQAEWGAPSAATAAGIAVSDCGWDSATNDGTSFASPPPYPANPLPKASQDQVLNLSVDSMADGCSTFNWTTQTGSCSSSFTGSFDAYSGSGIPSGCESVLSSSQANRTVILVPVYNSGSMCGRGEDGSYTLVGFAAFVVTGYHLPGFTASDWLNSANNCTGSQECVNGYFTQAVIPATGTIGGQDMGASIVQLTG
jgi:Flp pilus assembly protein TadG